MSFNLFDHAVWNSYKATYTLTNSTTKVIETKWNYIKSHIEKKPQLILYTYLLFLNFKTIIFLYTSTCKCLMRASKLVFFKLTTKTYMWIMDYQMNERITYHILVHVHIIRWWNINVYIHVYNRYLLSLPLAMIFWQRFLGTGVLYQRPCQWNLHTRNSISAWEHWL